MSISMSVNNSILVEGGTCSNLKKVLRQWIDLYVGKLPDDFSFAVSTNKAGTHLIQTDERLGNDLFYFLVNYLDCPKRIRYSVKVKGFTTGVKNDILKGKDLLVYVSPTDKEGDNVCAVTSENENFKIGFDGNIKKIENLATYEPPIESKFGNLEIIKRNKQQEKRKRNQKKLTAVDKRFKISFIVFGVLFVIIHLIFFTLGDKESFQKLIVVFGGGIWLWFLMDNEMLRHSKFYFRCLGISVLYAIYAGVLGNYLKNVAIHIVTLLALMLLIIQKPLRSIYLMLLKKEPKIDRSGTFEDLIYTIVLFIGSIWLSVSIMESLKKLV